MINKTLTLRELSEYIDIPERTLRNKVMKGEFPVKPLVGLTPRRWNKQAVDEWFNAHKSSEV